MLYQGREIKILIVFPTMTEIKVDPQRGVRLTSIKLADLDYGFDEVNGIARLLDADVLSGKRATIHNFLEILQPGYDIVWLITHAQEEGWYLSDGLVSASETTSLIRSSGAFLTVMNTCSSYEVAKQAAKEIGSAFICTVKEVPDRQAFITGVLFAQKLAAGYTYQEAFDEAKPGQNRVYELIEATKKMSPTSRDSGREYYDRSIMVDPATIMRLIKTVEEIEVIVNGSERFQTRSIRHEIQEIKTELKNILVEQANVRAHRQLRSWLTWGFAMAVVVLAAAQGLMLFLIINR